MIIESVLLENFKRHEHLLVEFTEGTNLLVGPNYAGKSTIIQAVMLGLFGNAAVPGQSCDLTRSGSEGFAVTVTLSSGVSIKRTPKNSTVTDQQGVVTVRTHTAVNAYVAELMGVDRKTFTKVFCSEQGSPQALLSMEGAELQRFIEVCLGVDAMDAVVKEAKLQVRLAQAKIDSKAEFLMNPADYETAVARDAELAADIASAEKKLEEDKAYIAAKQAATLALNVKITAQEAVNKKHEAYSQHKAILLEQLAGLPTARPALDPTKYDKQLAELCRQIKDNEFSKTETDRLTSCLKDHEKSRESYESVISLFAFDYNGAVITAEAAKDLAQEAGQVESLLGEEVKSLKKQLKSGVCDSCLRPFGTVEALATLKDSLEVVKEKRAEAGVVLDTAKAKWTAKVKQAVIYDNAATEASRAEGALRGCLTAIAALEQALLDTPPVDLEYDAAAVEALRDNLIQLQDSARTQAAEVAEEAKTRTKLEEEFDCLVVPLDSFVDLAQLEGALDTAQSLLNGCKSSMSLLTVDLASWDARLAVLRNDLTLHDRMFLAVVGLSEELVNYRTVGEVVAKSRAKIIDTGFTQILAIASEFVATCTGGYISEVYLSEGGIRYREGDHSRGTVCASGAQKSLMGVGLKLGVAQIVSSPFGCMLLDEVSADMDVDISVACLTVLGDYNQQSIVVSHRAMDVADNVIEL